jgi:uncharacterized protein YdiU (UPF0061 family)
MAREREHVDLRHYVEEWGMLFELLGANRMMGRILGWLLVCDPPEQTAKQVADGIEASISSVSTATRSLVQAGMIQRVGIPGERSAHYQVKTGMWADIYKRRMGYTNAMRKLAEAGYVFLPPGDKKSSLRLREIGSYCAFAEKEFLPLLDKWRQQWEKEMSSL